MIDRHDLMVGNWLKIPQKIIRVSNVVSNGVISDTTIYQEERIDPIPVTVDMLKRIGFEEHKGICPKTFYRYWDKEYRYKLDIDPDFCNSDRKFSIHIDNGDCETIGCGEFTYVHELQNLVRIITGFSLPITKEMLYGLESR